MRTMNVGVPLENYEWKLLAFANMKDLKRSLFLLLGNLTERSSCSLSLSGEATSSTESSWARGDTPGDTR